MDLGEQTIPCADSKCGIIVEDVIVKSLVSDPDVILKYNRLICNSFVKVTMRTYKLTTTKKKRKNSNLTKLQTKTFQWKQNLFFCNSPGCNYVIDTHSTKAFVTCKCGSEFCCECYDVIHAPISCKLLKKWKCDDSATHLYIAANTKACPSCHADIEKNGGCPHMVNIFILHLDIEEAFDVLFLISEFIV